MECTEWYQPTAGRRIICHREVNGDGRHKGGHQAFEMAPEWRRLWTWGPGGASGTSNFDTPGKNCMGCRPDAYRRTHQPEDHGYRECPACGAVHDAYRGPLCHACDYWQERVDRYNRTGPKGERFVRDHHDRQDGRAWLYVWSPGHGGAFGGRQFTVAFDDGSTVGPADYLWSNGQIPWWLVDNFPPNARIHPAERIL